ncbi:MAG: copper-binding protein [Gammaproteobacteria bacterium]|nr:copper-binding protein [Gammaproteobacteria bacterium]
MNQIIVSLVIVMSFGLALPSLAADMDNMGMTQQTEKTAHGIGVIKNINVKEGKITLAHQPIKELNWPAMTMAFKVTDPKLLEGLTVGKEVTFDLRSSGMSAVVTGIQITK